MLTFEDGRLQSRDEEEESASILDKIESLSGPDETFAEYIAQHPLPEDQKQAIIGYVEGFNAADHHDISTLSLGLQQAAEEASRRRPPLSHQRRLRPPPPVPRAKVHRSRRQPRPQHPRRAHRLDPKPRPHRSPAQRPTHHLRSRAKPSSPCPSVSSSKTPSPSAPLPNALHEANRLRMGHVRRFTLVFREKFWTHSESTALSEKSALSQKLATLSFLFSFASMPPVWWTPHPAPGNTLTGWVGGPRSEAFANFTPDQLGEAAAKPSPKSSPSMPPTSAISSSAATRTTGSTTPSQSEPTATSPPEPSTPAPG